MASPYLNYTENPLDFEKFKKKPKNMNLKSFWAFLLSTFVYISVFYVFNLSPSALLCTTKFWFIMSNTLILIIAADFSAFSSPKEHNFYDEYGKNHPRAKSVPSFETQYVRVDKKKMPKYQKKRVDEEPQEKIIAMIAAPDYSKNLESLENKPEIFSTSEKDDHPAEKPNTEFEKNKLKLIRTVNPEAENGAREVKKRKLKLVASDSTETALLAAAPAQNKGKMVPERTLSEEVDEGPRLEENEFSKMSNEEVNRRVEEFIRRFNRQIRLQAARNRRQDSEVLHQM